MPRAVSTGSPSALSMPTLSRAVGTTFPVSLISQASYCALKGRGHSSAPLFLGFTPPLTPRTYVFGCAPYSHRWFPYSLGTIILYQNYGEKQLVIRESFLPNMTSLAGQLGGTNPPNLLPILNVQADFVQYPRIAIRIFDTDIESVSVR